MKNQDLSFCCFQGGKISRKNPKNFLKTLFKPQKWKKDIKYDIHIKNTILF